MYKNSGIEHREERIGHQIMEHVGHHGHAAEHLGTIPNITRHRRSY